MAYLIEAQNKTSPEKERNETNLGKNEKKKKKKKKKRTSSLICLKQTPPKKSRQRESLGVAATSSSSSAWLNSMQHCFTASEPGDWVKTSGVPR